MVDQEKEGEDTAFVAPKSRVVTRIKTKLSFSKEAMRLPWYGPSVVSGEGDLGFSRGGSLPSHLWPDNLYDRPLVAFSVIRSQFSNLGCGCIIRSFPITTRRLSTVCTSVA